MRISGQGILGVTNSFLAMGPWVVGRYGEHTAQLLAIALDTVTYALDAAFDPSVHKGPPVLPRQNDGARTYLSHDVIYCQGTYALGFCISSRTYNSALEGLQLASAAVMHAMFIRLDETSFLGELHQDRELILSRLVDLSKLQSVRLTELEAVKRGFSNSSLQAQQDELCSMLTAYATPVMMGTGHLLNADELGEAIIDAAESDNPERSGFEQLLQVMRAFTGPDPKDITNAAIAFSCLRMMRNRRTDNNKMPLLLGCSRRPDHAHSKVTEMGMHHQGLQFGSKALDSALDDTHQEEWHTLNQHIKRGGRTASAYDNMVPKSMDISHSDWGKR